MKSLKKNIALKKGFGLLEIGLALLVVAVLGIYSYGQYASAREETLAQSEVADMTSYWAKTQQRYANQSNYAGLTALALVQSNVFPKSMNLIANTSVQNKYNGALAAAPINLTGTLDGVKFTLSGYNKAGCTDVIPKVANGARRIIVNGAAVKPLDATLNIALLGGSCTDTNTNVLEFDIGR